MAPDLEQLRSRDTPTTTCSSEEEDTERGPTTPASSTGADTSQKTAAEAVFVDVCECGDASTVPGDRDRPKLLSPLALSFERTSEDQPAAAAQQGPEFRSRNVLGSLPLPPSTPGSAATDEDKENGCGAWQVVETSSNDVLWVVASGDVGAAISFGKGVVQRVPAGPGDVVTLQYRESGDYTRSLQAKHIMLITATPQSALSVEGNNITTFTVPALDGRRTVWYHVDEEEASPGRRKRTCDGFDEEDGTGTGAETPNGGRGKRRKLARAKASRPNGAV